MTRVDDDTLAAYMDDELGAERAREVAQALAEAPALRDRLERLREVDAAVRRAFHRIDEKPAPRLRAPVQRLAPRQATPARPAGRWLPLAAAASLVALVGTGLGAYQLGRIQQKDVAEAERSRTVAMQRTFQDVVETELSGTTVTWQSPDGGARAEFTPVRTWRTESGRYCREFRELRVVDGVQQEEGGIACRRDDGTWQVRVRYYAD